MYSCYYPLIAIWFSAVHAFVATWHCVKPGVLFSWFEKGCCVPPKKHTTPLYLKDRVQNIRWWRFSKPLSGAYSYLYWNPSAELTLNFIALTFVKDFTYKNEREREWESGERKMKRGRGRGRETYSDEPERTSVVNWLPLPDADDNKLLSRVMFMARTYQTKLNTSSFVLDTHLMRSHKKENSESW